MRLDSWLVEHGAFKSRARAQSAIKAGLVQVDGAIESKASRKINASNSISIAGDVHPYVSRAALKLKKALDEFPVDLIGKTVLDIGASTGGFTEIALLRGASVVFAVDVGHGQLDESLCNDARVCNLEGVNARDLSIDIIPQPIDVLVSDVSFISLEKALPAGLSLCRTNADMIVLIKPQFEVGKSGIGKNGIVKDASLHDEACASVAHFIGQQDGWSVRSIIDSPIEGGDGNREFLLWASKKENTA